MPPVPGRTLWLLGTAGARTLERDLVATEPERRVCEACPVRDHCLSLAVLTDDTRDSIHGGLLPVQQQRVARAVRNADEDRRSIPFPRRSVHLSLPVDIAVAY